MERKLQFAFKCVASPSDGKTNVIAITSITNEDKQRYMLPENEKFASNHSELIKTESYKRMEKSLNQRGQKRKIWIKCTREMDSTYFDENGNIMFNDLYLEEIVETNIIEPTQKKEYQIDLKGISEQFMIEKFVCKHSNAEQWLETFERECQRFEIKEDNTKIEILRLFLDRACLDWHSATLTALTIEADWNEWKQRFLKSFADKGWSTGIYSISYRYKEGSLMEYAMRKEKLLLDMDNNIGTKTLIMLIAAGLPEFIRDKIDRENCQNSTELLQEIKKCENLVNKNSFTKKKFEEKKPCKNCEKLNKGIRYHSEDYCWFKKENRKETGINGNNSMIEVDLCKEQKKRIITPLIKIKIEEKLEVNVTYDPGSRLSNKFETSQNKKKRSRR
ncbi:uncharacterized protein LOC124431814 [Vespa crabro]|uniref:uncharacterized protein LOC124431814 n=1 Tax=Vespa crabro TaxID=7445 RepID=UPI001F0230F1|nr:uncharacterized protein LOC124431814 [Vespa crabro]XP_046836085.1 uncharacterized protein LOC124431814 [Vespa crabro]